MEKETLKKIFITIFLLAITTTIIGMIGMNALLFIIGGITSIVSGIILLVWFDSY